MRLPATSRKPNWPCGVCRNPNQRRRPSWLAPTAKATMRPPKKTTYPLISASCSCSESADPRPQTPAWEREAAESATCGQERKAQRSLPVPGAAQRRPRCGAATSPEGWPRYTVTCQHAAAATARSAPLTMSLDRAIVAMVSWTCPAASVDLTTGDILAAAALDLSKERRALSWRPRPGESRQQRFPHRLEASVRAGCLQCNHAINS